MSAMSSIEGLSFDVDLLTKRLKQDMKDDWFPDPLNFKDTLKNDVIEKYFNKYHKSPATLYSPSVAEQFNLPKKGFTLRYALETNIYDRGGQRLLFGSKKKLY